MSIGDRVSVGTVPLRYLASLNDQKLADGTSADLEFRYLDIGAVGRGRVTEDPVPMRFVDAPSRARRRVQAGDTVVSTVRTYLRAVWPVTGETDDLVVSTGFAVVRPRDIQPAFLAWALQSDVFIEEVVARSTGVSYPAINPTELAGIRVPRPPVDEQRQIADFLDAETSRIDALITAKQHMIELVDQQLARKLDDLLDDVDSRPAPLRRFTRSITQGTSGVAGAEPARDGQWGILKLSAVKNGIFRPSENKALGPEFPVDESLSPRPGDLLVTRSNTPAYVGDSAAIRDEVGQVLLPDLIYRVRLDDRLDPTFASMALRTSRARVALSSSARGTSQSMVKLRGEDILNVELPAPGLAEQRTMVAAHDALVQLARQLTAALTRQIELLRERRQALITAAVSGELTV